MFNDAENEIQGAIEEVRFGVKLIEIEKHNPEIIFKVTTLEDKRVFIALSERGFEVRYKIQILSSSATEKLTKIRNISNTTY